MNSPANHLRAALIAATLTLSGAAAYADTSFHPAASSPKYGTRWNGHHHRIGEFHRVLRQLKLTPDQHAQIRDIVSKAKSQLRDLRKTSQQTHRAYVMAIPGDANYRSLVASEKANAAARIQASSDIKAHIFAVLTPAQQAQIPSIVAADQAARAARIARWQEHRARS